MSLTTFFLIAPEYTSLINAQDYIDLADAQVGQNVCNRGLAVAYLAAHLVTMAQRGGYGGVVLSEGEGGLSRSLATSGFDPSLLAVTGYGQEYLRLVRSCGVGSFTMRTFSA